MLTGIHCVIWISLGALLHPLKDAFPSSLTLDKLRVSVAWVPYLDTVMIYSCDGECSEPLE